MKILSPRVHGFLDYLVVAFLLVAPSLFGLRGIAATLCYVVAPTQLVMSLLTDYPLGVAKLIPFTVHGAIEVVMALGLIAMPWLFGFSAVDVERNFFIASGVGLGLVWVMTNYAAASSLASTAARRDPY
jgi:hypothetical protein